MQNLLTLKHLSLNPKGELYVFIHNIISLRI